MFSRETRRFHLRKRTNSEIHGQMPDLPMREVVEEHEFVEQLDRLIFDAEEAEEFIAAAKTVLAHKPDEGMPATADGSIWSLAMPPIRGRTVTLYYTFDERTVTFLAIVAF